MDRAQTDIESQGVWSHFTVRDGLPAMKIESLYEDAYGNVWAGTHDRGVASYDGRRFSLLDRSTGLAGNGVFSITESSDGSLWFGTSAGPSMYDGEVFSPRLDSSISLLWGSHCGPTGTLWFGVGRRENKRPAICRVRGREADLVEIPVPAKRQGESIHAVHEDESGSLWIGGDALYECAVESGGLRVKSTLEQFLRVRSIERSNDGLTVADHNAIWRVGNGEAVIIADGYARRANAMSPTATSIMIGTERGRLCLVDGGVSTLRRFDRPVQSVLVDRKSRCWVGTYGLGLHQLDATSWRRFETDDGPFPAFALAATGGDRVVIGAGKGVWRGGEGHTIEHVGESAGRVSAVYSNGDDVWVGGRAGWLGKIEDGSFRRRFESASDPAHRVSAICRYPNSSQVCFARAPGGGLSIVTEEGPQEMRDIPLWIGALDYSDEHEALVIGFSEGSPGEGLALLQDSELQFLPLEAPVTALCVDGYTIWAGTTQGLFKIEGRTPTRIEIDGDHACDIVTCLHRDRSGVLWVGTEGAGIVRVRDSDQSTLTIPGDSASDVIRDIETDSSGRAWIATEGGLVVYGPKSAAPKVQLSAVGADEDASLSVSATQKIELLFDVPPADWVRHSHFQYRLNSDESWIRIEAPLLRIGPLAIGEHRIDARAIDVDLNVSEVASVALLVEADERDLRVAEALDTASTEMDSTLIGESTQMQHVRGELLMFASTDTTVLLLGETGTGKSIAAKTLHRASARRDNAFVKVNCAAMTETLAESELFGHERGAFTGAISRRIGKFQLAEGGTIFLDEIGDLPISVQAKLLNVLQDREVESVGSSKPQTVDVRVVAATNRDIESAIEAGQFREDLYYRLNTLTVTLPPLRERIKDALALAQHFTSEIASRLGKETPTLLDAGKRSILGYSWPGNVRELEHTMHRAVILSESGFIDESHLALSESANQVMPDDFGGKSLQHVERMHIEQVLESTNWVVQGARGAAEILGLKPSTLRSRMKKLGISRRGA